MKTVVLTLLPVAAILLGGCALMDPEDRDFYGKGWVKPTELDTAPVQHRVPDPSRPETVSVPAMRTTPSATPEPEWLAPVPNTR